MDRSASGYRRPRRTPLGKRALQLSYGHNDQVPENLANSLSRSLYLVRPDQLKLAVASEGGYFGPARRRVRARFDLCGYSYCIVVTDPWMERQCLAGSDGETNIDGALLCVSLGESFHGFAYKLAAAVITHERVGA